MFAKKALKGSNEEYEKMLDTYFNVPLEQQQNISDMMNHDKSKLTHDKLNTSEFVGESILSYGSLPEKFESRIPIKEVGNAWILEYSKYFHAILINNLN